MSLALGAQRLAADGADIVSVGEYVELLAGLLHLSDQAFIGCLQVSRPGRCLVGPGTGFGQVRVEESQGLPSLSQTGHRLLDQG